MRCSVVSNGPQIIQNESDSTELPWAQKHRPCLWVWALSSGQLFFLQELNHEQFDLQGAPAVMQERPSVCVTDCKSLYNHLSAAGKRSAIDVLIIRESMKKTGCEIRWAPTGLQLADGLTKDKGEAVECLRRRLRSGSYMLRGEEQVMQERHLTRVQELSASEESSTTEKY